MDNQREPVNHGSNQNGKNDYFNLTASGWGQLMRIRTVTPKKAAPFLACDIAALYGPCKNPESRRFDLKVVGKQAIQHIEKCTKAVAENRKVLVNFRIGDPWTDTFTYEKGKNEGQTGVSLKGRLLYIAAISIDGELVYVVPPKDEAAAQTQSEIRLPVDDENYELFISGIGYLNSIKTVTPNNSPSFLSCTVAAIHGDKKNSDVLFFDATVDDKDADHLVRGCVDAVTAKRKVLIGFRFGDLKTEAFTFSTGERAGEIGVNLKTRLLKINWIKIDGVKAYPLAAKDDDSASEEQPAASEPDVPMPAGENAQPAQPAQLPQPALLPAPSPTVSQVQAGQAACEQPSEAFAEKIEGEVTEIQPAPAPAYNAPPQATHLQNGASYGGYSQKTYYG